MKQNNQLRFLTFLTLAFTLTFGACVQNNNVTVPQSNIPYTKCRVTSFVIQDIPNEKDSIVIGITDSLGVSLGKTTNLGALTYGLLPKTVTLVTADMTQFRSPYYYSLSIDSHSPGIGGTEDLAFSPLVYRPAANTPIAVSQISFDNIGWKIRLNVEWRP